MDSWYLLNDLLASKDEKINEEEFNKENLLIEHQNVCNSKKSSRLSILKCLDPYAPIVSGDKDENISLNPISDILSNDVRTRNVDKSFNLLNFDDSIIEDNSDEDVKTPTKKDEHFIYQNDFVGDSNISMGSDKLSNISRLLDDSIQENDNVATDNLIGLSPVRQFVSKEKFDKVKKYHDKAEQDWSEKEANYQNLIAELEKENEIRINIVIKENEDMLETMRDNHMNAISIKELENEATIAKLNSIQEEKQSELDEMTTIMTDLHNELIVYESERVLCMISCDHYSDAINELIVAGAVKEEILNLDNQHMCSFLKTCMDKEEKFKVVFESLEENKAKLVTQIGKYKLHLDNVNAAIEETEKLSADMKDNKTKGINDLTCICELRLKRLGVSCKHLENVESNLKEEIGLVVAHVRDMTELLTSIVDQE